MSQVDVQEISLASLPADPDEAFPFSFSFPLEDAYLQRSIERYGLLHPPCVQTGFDCLQVVYGARRVMACRRLGKADIAARVLRAPLPPEKALQLSLQEDLGRRRFNAVEQGRVLQKFHQLDGWSDERVAQEITPALALPSHIASVAKYRSLAALPVKIQEMLASEDLMLQHLFELLPLRTKDRQAILSEIFEKCQPSLNEGREIITLLQEVAARRGCRIAELLTQPEFAEILSQKHLQGRELVHKLRALLRKVRYPRLSAMQKRFSETTTELGLSQIQVRHAPHFEQDGVEFGFKAGTPDEFRRKVEILRKAGEARALQSLFEIGKS